jgi:chaperonin GroES
MRGMKVRPCDDKVIVVKDRDVEGMSAGGIILPATAKKERVFRGTVKSVGPGRVRIDRNGIPQNDRIPMQIRAGDRIIFVEGHTHSWEHLGVTHHLLSERNVIGVIEEESGR